MEKQWEVEQFNKKNPVDKFFTKVGDRIRGYDSGLSTGNQVADIGANIIGTIPGMFTPDAAGQSVAGLTNQFTQGARAAAPMLTRVPQVANVLNKPVIGSMAKWTATGAVESVPYTLKEGVEDTPGQFVRRAATDIALGAAGENIFGAVGDVAKGLKQNKQIKNIDTKLDTYKSKGILPGESKPGEFFPKPKPKADVPKIDKPNKSKEFKYDTDTNTLNSKEWYHGTGTANLTSDSLDTNMTNIEGLFGHGVYLTDDVDIAKGYASARSKKTNATTIYQANVKVDKVLDLEKPINDDAFKAFDDLAKSLDRRYGSKLSDSLNELYKNNATGDQIYRRLSEEISDISNYEGIPKSEFVEDFQYLTYDLKNAGYDAYTHIGGKRTGKDPHQVLIMLDPNDTISNTGLS